MKVKERSAVYEAVQYRQGEQDGSLAAYVVSGAIRYPEDGTMLVKTEHGVMCAKSGDWIVIGPRGDLQFHSPATFAAQFEPA